MTQIPRDPLNERLAQLPLEIEAPPQIWDQVVTLIGPPAAARVRPSHWRPIALAASVACLVLVGALMWVLLERSPTSTVGVAASVPMPNFAEPTDVRYTAARDALQLTFHERLAQLDPATRTQIEASLAVIQRAHEDIRRALMTEPANPVLEQLFESTWHDEIDLYDHVVRATQPFLART